MYVVLQQEHDVIQCCAAFTSKFDAMSYAKNQEKLLEKHDPMRFFVEMCPGIDLIDVKD
jgi:hypothetical protein